MIDKAKYDSFYVPVYGPCDEELREIIILRFSQELKLGEIAKVTGLPMRTVQSRLRKALRILKTELEGRET